MTSRSFHRLAVASASLPLVLAALSGCQAGAGKPGSVSGRYIVSLGDADMAAAALTSRELGPREPGSRDTLTVVSLPIQEPQTPHAQINVGNSALCPPTCLAVSKDGRYAFVVDYRGEAPEGAATIDDLPKGKHLVAVDLDVPLNPRICATAEVSEEPIAVSVNQAGTLVAVATQTPRQQIVIVPFTRGEFTGEPSAWPLLGLDDDEAKPTSIAWHPGGAALAVTLQNRGEVMFYRFRVGDDGSMELAPWGTPVKVGKAPGSGAFSPDGRYFIVNDLQWGSDVEGYNVGVPQGQLVVIMVGDMPAGPDSSLGGPAGHIVIGSAPVGVSPIGMAISSDGSLVATANLQRSHLPDSDPRVDPNQRGGSLSLLQLRSDGSLTPLAEYPINSMPAGLSFDARDQFLCVTQFRSFDPNAVDGELAFWKVKRTTPRSLEQADFYVGVGKGPHGVLIVR